MGKHVKWGVAAVVVAVALSVPAATLAVWPGDNDDIVFISGRGGGGDASSDIYFLNGPLGAITGPLTPNLTGQHRHPDGSPNGQKIAFALFNSASDRDVWTVPTNQTGAVPLRDTDNQQEDRPAWSPDGKFIAYESEEPPNCPIGDQPCDQFDVFITEVKTGNTTNLTAGTPASNQGKPAWSPDGKNIYYQGDQFGDLDIFMEKADGTQTTPTTILVSGIDEYQPSLSPDGSAMCFTKGGPLGSPTADVYKLSPVTSGGTQTDISDNTAAMPTAANADYNCGWSPDGQFIAFVQGTFSNGKLQYEDANDADAVNNSSPLTPEQVGVNDTVFDGNPFWSRVPQECDDKPAGVIGTENSETLNGFKVGDVMQALGGDDTVKGKRGNDTACGKGGKDKVLGGEENDKLFGGGGADSVNGGPGHDKCFGGPSADTFKECEDITP